MAILRRVIDVAWGFVRRGGHVPLQQSGRHSTDAPRRRPLLTVVGLLAALPLAYAAFCALVVLLFSLPWKWPLRRSPRQYGLAFKEVSFPSRVDAIRLEGWLMPPAAGTTPRRPVVMVHGKRTDRQGEVGGRVLEIAAGLVRAGHPVLMFDSRGAGRSGWARVTLGAREVRDVAGAIDFLEGCGLCPEGVLLLGYSMGAATSLLAAPADPRVRGVAVDGAYTDVKQLLEDHLPRVTRIPALLMPGIAYFSRLLLDVDIHAIRPVDGAAALAARGTPLLVIHGDADWAIPISHSRRIAAAHGPKAETLFVPGAAHTRSYAVDPAAYLARLVTFFEGKESAGGHPPTPFRGEPGR